MLSKKCNECGKSLHGRSKSCKNCGSSDIRKVNEELEVNWKELKEGDRIKVTGGPYYEGENGKISLGYYGEFKVKEVIKEGILCFNLDRNEYGTCFVYMGPNKKGVVGQKEAHKIKLIAN